MVWGTIWTVGVLSLWSVLELSMLKNILAFWTKGLLPVFYNGKLMQDRAPCHTAKKTKD